MGSNTFMVETVEGAEKALYEEFVIHASGTERKALERAVNRAVMRLRSGDTRMYNETLGCWIQLAPKGSEV